MFTELECPVTDAEKKRLMASLPRNRSYFREWGWQFVVQIGVLAGIWLLIAW